MLEEDILNFAMNELKTFHKILNMNYPELIESQELEKVTNAEEDEKRVIKKAFLKIALEFMRSMKQEMLAHILLNSKIIVILIFIYVCVFFKLKTKSLIFYWHSVGFM